jgi:hypothetical protein
VYATVLRPKSGRHARVDDGERARAMV